MRNHEPNTPRTHNDKGERVNKPVQCEACLQSWPCDVERLRRDAPYVVDGQPRGVTS